MGDPRGDLGGATRRHHSWRWAEKFLKYGVSRSLEMAFSESSIPYTHKFWWLLFRYTKPCCWISTSTRLHEMMFWLSNFFRRKRFYVIWRKWSTESLLIVNLKCATKATCNIFKNQLGYFRNLWEITKLWVHREVLVEYVMLMVNSWELATMPCIHVP
jgi:hypothetical protein